MKIGIIFICGLLLFSILFAVSTLSRKYRRELLANCATDKIRMDSTFGNSCTAPVERNTLKYTISKSFTGPFDELVFIVLPAALFLFGITLYAAVRFFKKGVG